MGKERTTTTMLGDSQLMESQCPTCRKSRLKTRQEGDRSVIYCPYCKTEWRPNQEEEAET